MNHPDHSLFYSRWETKDLKVLSTPIKRTILLTLFIPRLGSLFSKQITGTSEFGYQERGYERNGCMADFHVELWRECCIANWLIFQVETDDCTWEAGWIVFSDDSNSGVIKQLPRGIHQYMGQKIDTSLSWMESGAFLQMILSNLTSMAT